MNRPPARWLTKRQTARRVARMGWDDICHVVRLAMRTKGTLKRKPAKARRAAS